MKYPTDEEFDRWMTIGAVVMWALSALIVFWIPQ